MIRRNEVALIAGNSWQTPYLSGGRITIELSPARACRVAEFELRTGMKIEAAILDFLNDELFNTAAANPAPSREPSTSRE